MQQHLQRIQPIRQIKTIYEEQLQNSQGLFQRLWSVEDPGGNIRYLVYAYITSNWRICHNEHLLIICLLAYLFSVSTFVAFSYEFALLQLAL